MTYQTKLFLLALAWFLSAEAALIWRLFHSLDHVDPHDLGIAIFAAFSAGVLIVVDLFLCSTYVSTKGKPK